jgi:hypothetical protein
MEWEISFSRAQVVFIGSVMWLSGFVSGLIVLT